MLNVRSVHPYFGTRVHLYFVCTPTPPSVTTCRWWLLGPSDPPRCRDPDVDLGPHLRVEPGHDLHSALELDTTPPISSTG